MFVQKEDKAYKEALTYSDIDEGLCDVVFSFDTTGSMSSVIESVRNNLQKTIERLFQEIKGIRIGIISHGDYCDYPNMCWMIDLSTDIESIKEFIKEVPKTSGGDAPEMYEYVLHIARGMKWKSNVRVLVVIGDQEPHTLGYEVYYIPNRYKRKNYLLTPVKKRIKRDIYEEEVDTSYERSDVMEDEVEVEDKEEEIIKIPGFKPKLHLDWKEELKMLIKDKITIFGCQALSNINPTVSFYKDISSNSGGYHFKLDKLNMFPEYMIQICNMAADAAEGAKLLLEEKEELERVLSQHIESGILPSEQKYKELEHLSQAVESLSISYFSPEAIKTAKKIRIIKCESSRAEKYESKDIIKFDINE